MIAALAIVFAIALPLLNEPLLTTWSVSIDSDQPLALANAMPNTAWTIEQNQGTLSVDTTAIGLGLSRALYILVLWGIIVAIIWYLRRVVDDVRHERPFNVRSSQYLKRAGYLLVALPLWLFIEEFVRFYIFVPNAMDISEYKFTHIQLLTESKAEVAIYPDFNIGILIAGLFVLVIAKAFEIGMELQRDSDEII